MNQSVKKQVKKFLPEVVYLSLLLRAHCPYTNLASWFFVCVCVCVISFVG